MTENTLSQQTTPLKESVPPVPVHERCVLNW